jgi:hypothetical protein
VVHLQTDQVLRFWASLHFLVGSRGRVDFLKSQAGDSPTGAHLLQVSAFI